MLDTTEYRQWADSQYDQLGATAYSRIRECDHLAEQRRLERAAVSDEVFSRLYDRCGLSTDAIQRAIEPGTAIMFTKDRTGNFLSAVKVVNLEPSADEVAG